MQARALCLAFLGSLGLMACDTQPSMPGTALGTYSVQAAMHANSCGAQLGAPDPWTFDADLSRDGQLLYWRQNGQVLDGSIDSGSKTSIASSQAAQIGSNSQCSMTRTDTLALTLSAEATPSITGGLTFHFDAPASACASLLTSNGGIYAVLPCQVEYTLKASQSKAP
jgi:hypothetical protein